MNGWTYLSKETWEAEESGASRIRLRRKTTVQDGRQQVEAGERQTRKPRAVELEIMTEAQKANLARPN